MILFGTYNICNGRTSGLDSALREIYQANLDLGLFQYTKVLDDIHMRMFLGYRVVVVYAPGQHHGGVAVF